MRLTLLLFLSVVTLNLHAGALRFAPLPMDISPKLHQHYTSMLHYLEQQTGMPFEFVYCANYEEVIAKLKKGELDLAELGPLPYVEVAKRFPYVKPFLTFLTKDAEASYTCKLITVDRHIASIDDLNASRDHLFLTSKHSTCGPLMTGQMLERAGKKLKDFNYTYAKTHTNVILQNLLTPNAFGGVKSTVYATYAHLGLRTLATSVPIPGFAFVANTQQVSDAQIERIQNAILKLRPLDNEHDWQITKHWGENIRYGAIPAETKVYDALIKAQELMPLE